MTDRPILFSAPMIRALLAGTKTQTRRVLKGSTEFKGPYNSAYIEAHKHNKGWSTICPYGQPGDRLWVRESHWWFVDEHDPVTGYFPPKLTADDVEYRADGEKPGRIWRPSIHMHRWASRITLEITGVRVERLQEISEADAIAEGIQEWPLGYRVEETGAPDHRSRTFESAQQAYRWLWESINGPGSWDANPWVWVVEFRRVTP